MARVFSDRADNLLVYIYSDDHLPPHVHVFIGRKRSRDARNIKISIGDDNNPPQILEVHPKIQKTDVRKAWQLVADNQDELLIEWKKIHDSEEVEK
ncbi:MAG: DUF4160 domain-containing protein [Plectolyngbya sp. WJT66-NPBG17]|jgi:hypothetical protein|nr:DUF4160 domain-containing protein [Plectolyngbya sp. WJT66-NPBG17]